MSSAGADLQRIMVTGGAGFIGSALCRYLVAEGFEVLNIDKLTYAANLRSLEPIADNPRYRFEQADVADAVAMREAIAAFRPDAIMHLAAESHVDRSITGSAAFIETNILGTYRLLEAARDYWSSLKAAEAERFRFLQVSTDEVYGSLGAEGLFTETTPYNPSSPYSASKAAADHLGIAWQRTYGMPVVVSNCSNNYGPYHYPEKLIPLALTNALEGRAIPVYGDGSNVRDWLYVEDHVRALLLAVARGEPGRKYNIGGRSESSNLDLVRLLCDVLDELVPEGGPHQRLIEFVADRPGHDQRYAIDPTEVETGLGWRAEESLESGLRKTVRWYMDNRDWWEPIRGTYRGERLGLLTPAAGGAGGA